MQDYVLALPQQAEWIPLGPHHAPCFLKTEHRKAVCDIFAVPIPGHTVSDDPLIAHLNVHYWATPGEAGRVVIWTSEPVGLDYPALMRLFTQEFREIHDGLVTDDGTPLADAWLRHPGKRLYQRIVIVPRGNDA